MKINYYDLVKSILSKKIPIIDSNSLDWHKEPAAQAAFRDCSKLVQADTNKPVFKGRGIVICAGGKYFPSAWVTIRSIRHHGCKLPIELWYLGNKELNKKNISIFKNLNIKFIDAKKLQNIFKFRNLYGYELKSYAIKYSEFKEVLYLDADNSPTMDPEYLFETDIFKEYGSYFFRDKDHFPEDPNYFRLNGFDEEKCKIFDIDFINEPSSETGQILLDKEKCWKEICLAAWWNEFSEYTYNYTWYDKDTFVLAWRQTKKPYFLVKKHPITGFGLQQFDHENNLIFLHRCGDKWSLGGNKYLDRPQEYLLHSFIEELKKIMMVNLL